MIKIEKAEVMGFESAIRGMRNPHNSWNKSDSGYCSELNCNNCGVNKKLCLKGRQHKHYIIGKKDMELCKKLIRGGSVHRKFIRQIFVSVDITAPLYWWKEFDTYKIGTVTDSCSTMHTIHKKEFTIDDFSTDHLSNDVIINPLDPLIDCLNFHRELFLQGRCKDDWYTIIQLLPSSYNQKRTVTMNYEVLLNICKWRSQHKLDEWVEFCKFCNELPYFKKFRDCINS